MGEDFGVGEGGGLGGEDLKLNVRWGCDGDMEGEGGGGGGWRETFMVWCARLVLVSGGLGKLGEYM